MKPILIAVAAALFSTTPIMAQELEGSGDLLRIVCEHVDYNGEPQGTVMVIDQVSSRTISGSEMLALAPSSTDRVEFLLRLFEASLDDTTSLESQVASIVEHAPIEGGEVGGQGYFMGNNFAFNHNRNRAGEVRFIFRLRNLASGSFFRNSHRVSSYVCRPPYTIPETRAK